MATINPYAGDVINFPPGTPASVMNAYYNAVLRNRMIEDAQVPWWQQAVSGLTNDVLNPFIKQVGSIPFQDYRSEFETDQNIRQATEIGADSTARKIQELRYAQDLANEDLMSLGAGAGQFADLATTPGPQTITDTGSARPYDEYQDPFSTGVYHSGEMERRPTSQSLMDEEGNVYEEERGPEVLTPSQPSGESNIFQATPGKLPSSAEVIAQMAAKYPTMDLGRLLKLIGGAGTMSMIDANKQEKAAADIEAQKALAAQRMATAGEKESLLAARERLLGSQADAATAKAEQARGVTALNTRKLATEQGRAELRQETLDLYQQGLLNDEQLQQRLALIRDAQVTETPGQRADREMANIKAKPVTSKGTSTSIRQQEMQEWARLEQKRVAGTIDPTMEEPRRAALEKVYGKKISWEDVLMGQFTGPSGEKPSEAMNQTGKKTPPPGVPKHYVQALTKDGRTMWVDPKEYDRTKYTLK